MRGPIHDRPHPMKGKRAVIQMQSGQQDGELHNMDVVAVSDWFDRITGKSWRDVRGLSNQIASGYGRRRQAKPTALPNDDEVVVVVAPSGQLRAVHQSEVRQWPGND